MAIHLHPSFVAFKQQREELSGLLNTLVHLCEQRQIRVVDDNQIADLQPIYEFDQQNLQSVSIAQVVQEAIANANLPFRIGTIGDFSRGKTTLINALVGRRVLTSDSRPNTAARTVVRYADHEYFRVNYFAEKNLSPVLRHGPESINELGQYTSDSAVDLEEYNQRLFATQESLAEQIEEVELYIESDYLYERTCELYDTPGLASPFVQHQVITYNTLPHLDLIIFVTQADPGVSAGELAFLSSFKDHLDRVVFALTKIDKLESSDDVKQMIEFTQDAIRTNLGIEKPEIFPINTIAALEQQIETSGLQALAQGIDFFLSRRLGRQRIAHLEKLALTICKWLQHDFQWQQSIIEIHNTELTARLAIEKEMITFHKQQLESLDTYLNQVEPLNEFLEWNSRQFRAEVQISIESKLRSMTINELIRAPYHLHQTVTQLSKKYINLLDQIFIHEFKLIRCQLRKIALLPEDADNLVPVALSADIHLVIHFILSLQSADAITRLTVQFGIADLLRNFFVNQLRRVDQTSHQNAYDHLVFGKGEVIDAWKERYREWKKQILLVCQNNEFAYLNKIIAEKKARELDIVNEQTRCSQLNQNLQEQLSWINQLQEQIFKISEV